ncbi:hypothetical protein LCI18_010977 [Fusarium solani-melongenae]|uniref:Uncharacterized protein n=1 Tax=Fusarium solani subsp. cucurbitae TaxID=2747967 RepID=A0ACD3ZG39_FUSSC|nr:hypothetical protein LCI18_010977 [Fusarium solani-melongenae]
MFIYKPISEASKEFRLIRLACAPEAEVVNLELCHALADDQVPYHAVSYVWGDPKDTARVSVDGEEFIVSENLLLLLQQLLRAGVTSWLWTDSICINQADLEEKTWQVNAMDRIYGNAKLVYLWLGPGTPRTDKAMKLLCEYGRQLVHELGPTDDWDMDEVYPQLYEALSTKKKPRSNAHPVAKFLYKMYKEPGLHRRDDERPLSKYPLMDGLRNLLERPFWRRVWIVQEVTLAQDALLLCGDESMPIQYFIEAIDVIREWTEIFNELSNFSFLWGLGQAFFTTSTLILRKLRLNSREPSLVHVLLGIGTLTGPRYLASEPRDLVFGLLSVVRERDSFGLHADYTEPVGTVFARATKAFIDWWRPKGDGDDSDWEDLPALDDLRPTNTPGMPSWTPDYEAIGKDGFDIHTIKYSCFACASKGAPNPQLLASPDEDPMVLRRLGCVVDTITKVMPPLPDVSWADETDDAKEVARAFAVIGRPVIDFMDLGPESAPEEDYIWKTVMLSFQDLFDEDEGRPDDKDIPLETWQVIRALFRGEKIDRKKAEAVLEYLGDSDGQDEWEDVDSEGETSGDDSGSEDDDSSDSDEEDSAEDKLINNFWTTQPDLKGRTLFKTANGRLGMARTNVKEGDIVTVIWSVPAPIVLQAQGSQYRFLGDAYVEGIMKGEFLDAKPEEVVFELI